jgi:hypothetical protein
MRIQIRGVDKMVTTGVAVGPPMMIQCKERIDMFQPILESTKLANNPGHPRISKPYATIYINATPCKLKRLNLA